MEKYVAITHSNNFIYGAGRSFCATVNNLDRPFDLVIPKPLAGTINIDEIRKYFNDNLQEVYVKSLPFKRCFMGRESIRIRGHIYITIKNVLYYLKKKKLKHFLANGDYSFIYLNSLVLYPILEEIGDKGIIHIRETFKGNNGRKVSDILKKARNRIFISQNVEESMKAINVDGIQINNPFDMNKVEHVDGEKIKSDLGILNEIVFSILGQTIAARGVDFIANIFREKKFNNAKLLIVGNLDTDCGNMLKAIAKENKNIILTGEIKEVENIYAISDYILRGEDRFALGRTIYEGLYAGCSVIIPGDKGKDIYSIDRYQHFQEQIIFYEPRNSEELAQIIMDKIQEGHNIINHITKDNIEEYVGKFNKMLESGNATE